MTKSTQYLITTGAFQLFKSYVALIQDFKDQLNMTSKDSHYKRMFLLIKFGKFISFSDSGERTKVHDIGI